MQRESCLRTFWFNWRTRDHLQWKQFSLSSIILDKYSDDLDFNSKFKFTLFFHVYRVTVRSKKWCRIVFWVLKVQHNSCFNTIIQLCKGWRFEIKSMKRKKFALKQIRLCQWKAHITLSNRFLCICVKIWSGRVTYW